jgi:hypothetical protein
MSAVPADPTAPHYVYEFYDADAEHLYIGRTNHIGNRLGSHMARQPWWTDVANIFVIDRRRDGHETRRRHLTGEYCDCRICTRHRLNEAEKSAAMISGTMQNRSPEGVEPT